MAVCGNCKRKLSCSCQVRIAVDKRQCCTACLAKYEQSIGFKRPEENTNNNTTRPSPGR